MTSPSGREPIAVLAIALHLGRARSVINPVTSWLAFRMQHKGVSDWAKEAEAAALVEPESDAARSEEPLLQLSAAPVTAAEKTIENSPMAYYPHPHHWPT